MRKLIEKIKEDFDLFLKDKTPSPLRKQKGDKADIRATRLIIFSLLWASVGYQSVLRFGGLKIGKEIGLEIEERKLDTTLNRLKKILESLNWGKIETKVDLEAKTATLTITDSLTAAGASDANQRLCFFEEGFIEGFLEGVIYRNRFLHLGIPGQNIKEVRVKETKCIGLGNDYCEFKITLGS